MAHYASLTSIVMDSGDVFRVHRIALMVLGLWPTKRVIYWIYSSLLLVPFCFIFTISEFANLFFISDDLHSFAVNLCYFIPHLMTCLKITLFLSKVRKIQELCERFGTTEFLPDPKRGIEESRIVRDTIDRIFNCLLILYILGTSVLLCGFIAPFYRQGNPKDSENQKNSTIVPHLPYHSYVPCDPGSSPCFEIMFGYQATSAFICTYIIIHCDTLYVALVFHCCSQFRMLNGSLETLTQRAATSFLAGQREEQIRRDQQQIDRESLRLGANCVKHHQAILEVKVYKPQSELLPMKKLNHINDLSSIENNLFLLIFTKKSFKPVLHWKTPFPVIDMSSFDLITMTLFSCAMIYELFILCNTGNEMEIESKKVSRSAYNAQWTSASEPVKKILLLMMLRAERPVLFTVGKFAKLSLRTFLSVGFISIQVNDLIKYQLLMNRFKKFFR
ncbi:odorant receptor Or2-like [Athalia rosae]|uniref:odorant receptor Or2-like n=1 Tax=Athalia rosae TaxID=37344 RepID=UPI00203488BF|nr:odorant receptor Or2-like [Athalia rosae]